MGRYSTFLRVCGVPCFVDLSKLEPNDNYLNLDPLEIPSHGPTSEDFSLYVWRYLGRKIYNLWIPNPLLGIIQSFFQRLVPLENFGQLWHGSRLHSYWSSPFQGRDLINSILALHKALVIYPARKKSSDGTKRIRQMSRKQFDLDLMNIKFPGVYTPCNDPGRRVPEGVDPEWLEDGFCEDDDVHRFVDDVKTLIQTSNLDLDQTRPPCLEFAYERYCLFGIVFEKDQVRVNFFNFGSNDSGTCIEPLWPDFHRLDCDGWVQKQVSNLLGKVPLEYLQCDEAISKLE
jgi:hypothetical protein